MKKIILLFLCALFATISNAQITDNEAKELYQKAEDLFDEKDYYECYEVCNNLEKKIGKSNPKILYLKIKAIKENLDNNPQKSNKILNRNYNNYNNFVQNTNNFFSLIDKDTYPSDKYDEILRIQNQFKTELKNYEFEKDRKPEDAIAFLNAVGKKFGKKINYSYESWGKSLDIKFSMDSSKLIIDAGGVDDLEGKPRFRSVGKERLIIDLSKAWFINEKVSFYDYTRRVYDLCTWDSIGGDRVYNNASVVITTTSTLDGNTTTYDNIFYYRMFELCRKCILTNEEFEKKLLLKKSNTNFFIYGLFDQNSEEFKEGGYQKRIRDAFVFLIDYYGGGTPIVKKEIKTSKF